PNATLIVSFVGFDSQEVPVKGKGSVQVTLQSTSNVLETIVVTAYESIDKHLFTGAVSTIKGADAMTDGMADISRSLQGKAAGVQVQNVSGTFGASPKLRVRGASSIYGNQKPLWVVDGIALEDVVDVSPDDLSSGNPETLISSAIAGLNADDIESFQILKDAAATSLYGARAMNGVVVITTKKGRRGSLQVNYTGEFTSRLKPSYSNYNIMNSQEQMMVYKEMEEKGWLNYSDVSRGSNGGVYKQMYDLISQWDASKGQFGMPNTPEAKARFLQQYETINTNWFDVLFKNSLQQNHSINVAGGTEHSRFYGSLSYFGDDGWSIGDKVQRYTGNTSASFDINKYVAVSLLSNSSVRIQQAPGTNNRVVNSVEGTYTRNFDINPFSYALNTSRVQRPYDNEGNLEYYTRNYAPFNIINELDNHTLDIKMIDTKLQGELEVKPVKGLSMKAIGSFRYVLSSREQKINENSNQAMAYRANEDSYVNDHNPFLYDNPENLNLPSVVILPYGGFYNRDDNNLLSFNERAMATYDIDISKHKVNILLGQELKYTDRSNSFNKGYGYQWGRGGTPYVDYLLFKQMGEDGVVYYGYDEKRDRFSSFFSKLSYSYAGRYVVNATGRYDGSNQLGRTRSSRWLPTWSLSGSWNIHEEPFMANNHVIPVLTLRLSRSMNANMPGSVSNALAVYNNDLPYRPTLAETENRVVISELENSELTWEKLHETNMGLDIGLLDNRVSLSSDFYLRQSFDLIGDIRTSGIGGQVVKRANYADMEIYGIELTLNTRNIVLKNFSWTTNLTFAYNHNQITHLEGRPRVLDLVRDAGYPREGYPQRSLFSIPFIGLNSEGLPQTLNEDGEITVGDINFQETIKTDYLKYEGPIDPPYIGGFENTVKYKNIRLSVYLSYQFGNVLRLDNTFSRSYSDLSAMPKDFMDRWVLPGDEAYTNIPVIASLGQSNASGKLSQAYSAYNYSDVRVCSGSFVRLKDITLSYDLPKRLLSNLGIGSVQFRCIASNLLLLYSDKNLKGQDPEFFRSGGVAMPVPKQVTCSIRVGF
ncbi:TonB-dependent receptor SusC, partial [termite gut metagenome]